MATVVRDIASFWDAFGVKQATLGITYDDGTQAISDVHWTVNSGTLILTLHQPGKQDQVFTRTTTGSMNVGGQGLTRDVLNQTGFEVNWTSG